MIEINNVVHSRVDQHFLQKVGRQVLAKEKQKNKNFSVALVGEERMRQLNWIYRRVDRSTNVLSFPMKEFGLGELVLCPATIRKDAAKYGITFKAELHRIFIHGLLHLLSYDHESSKDFKKMSLKEKRYSSFV
jgi:probable rRNA maturation factor